ncbi:MAG: hypothetical protein RBU45_24020 [Myxococcota bacterium]|nr:hypothetical protein [Myxococcota bacterium]
MAGRELSRLTGALREVLTAELGPLGDPPRRPELLAGRLVVVPGRETVAPKDFPLDALLHKIVMARDRLRLVEAVINSADGLDDLDRLRLHLRLTRAQQALGALAGLLQP